jgi:hypothetical protein
MPTTGQRPLLITKYKTPQHGITPCPSKQISSLTLLKLTSPELTKSSRRPGVAMISWGFLCSCRA